MTTREIGWAICLAGLPWSYFLIRQFVPFQHLDLWHANSWWMQGWILLLAGVHATTQRPFGRIPPALWWMMVWSTLSLLWVFNANLRANQPYPMAMFAGISNLWLILLALLTMTAWTPRILQTIITAIFWSGVILIGYGWMQVANLDQFFTFIDGSRQGDQLVGTIGNGTHFAGQLALWIPIALIQARFQKLWILPAIGLIVLAHSSVALVVTVGVGVAYVWRRSWKMGLGTALTCGLGGLGLILTHPGWLNPYGRWITWTTWWNDILLQRPILGWTVGFVKQMTQTLPETHLLFRWKHLHNEYLQWWVETGAIGLVLLGWAMWTLWQRRHHSHPTALRWACGAVLCACAAMGLLNFPAHLWQLGGWGLVGLAGWIVLTEEMDGRSSYR